MTLKSNSSIHLKTKGIKVNRMTVHVEKYSGDYLKRITVVVTQKNRGIKCWKNSIKWSLVTLVFNFGTHDTEFFSFWHSWFLTAWRIRGCISSWLRRENRTGRNVWSARAGNLTEKWSGNTGNHEPQDLQTFRDSTELVTKFGKTWSSPQSHKTDPGDSYKRVPWED